MGYPDVLGSPKFRRHEVAGSPLYCNARDNGMAGDGRTNDQPALATLVNKLGAGYAADGRARIIYCPPGVYLICDAGTVWRSGVSLVGCGAGATRFVLSNAGNRAEPVPLAYFTAQLHGASPTNHLAHVEFARFEIDGSGVALAEYNPLAKGLGLQYITRGIFRDLYIHHTAATGLGCDYLQDCLIDTVLAAGCGREDNGTQMGGAGIGVGVGGWPDSVERFNIINCSAVGNATNGIFVELQDADYPRPRGARIIGCHAQGNRFGISDWGMNGLIVSMCTMTGNLDSGFHVSAKGTGGTAGKGGLLTDCIIDGNLRDGISVGNTPGPYTIRGNRISGNGRHGYHHRDLGEGTAETALSEEIVIESNEFYGNSCDGIRIDRPMREAVILNNRIRNNGRQCAPAAASGGEYVRYTERTVVDSRAAWRDDGHRGKVLRVGDRYALVAENSATELRLAAIRPGEETSWSADTPPQGSHYELPETGSVRAGLTINAAADSLTIRGNRIWDSQDPQTQMYGIWITERGGAVACRVQDNDLVGNECGGMLLDTPPVSGRWTNNDDGSAWD